MSHDPEYLKFLSEKGYPPDHKELARKRRDQALMEFEDHVLALVGAPATLPEKGGEPEPPPSDEIPPLLQRYAEADETAEEFRTRLNRMLFRFGIKAGEHFLGGGEELSIDEKIKLLPMLVANFKAGNWLKLDEELEPKD